MNLESQRRLLLTSSRARGFTLIELMIAVAIIAILAAIAYPSYRDYVIRGRLTDGTNALAAMQADMERHFQDNRDYRDVTVGGTTFTSPCNRPVAQRTVGNGAFVLTCPTLTAVTYTINATGNGVVNNFVFTINQTRDQTTLTSVAGWTAAVPNTCWVVRRGQGCL